MGHPDRWVGRFLSLLGGQVGPGVVPADEFENRIARGRFFRWWAIEAWLEGASSALAILWS